MESNIAALDLEMYAQCITDALPQTSEGSTLESPLIIYPGRVSLVRAFMYSCVCGDANTNVFSDH